MRVSNIGMARRRQSMSQRVSVKVKPKGVSYPVRLILERRGDGSVKIFRRVFEGKRQSTREVGRISESMAQQLGEWLGNV